MIQLSLILDNVIITTYVIRYLGVKTRCSNSEPCNSQRNLIKRRHGHSHYLIVLSLLNIKEIKKLFLLQNSQIKNDYYEKEHLKVTMRLGLHAEKRSKYVTKYTFANK